MAGGTVASPNGGSGAVAALGGGASMEQRPKQCKYFPHWWIVTWIVWMFAASANAATWYVDDDNDGGTENGTSLATAWGKASDVVWASLSAGDTILISKGVYDAPFSATKGGTPASKITISINSDPAEVGLVIFKSSGVVAFSGSGASNVVVNGSLSGSFAVPTNAFGVTNLVAGTAITNNIGIWATNGISGFSCSAPMNGIEIRWVAQLYMTNHPSGYGSSHAFAFAIGSGGSQRSNIIEYCYVKLTGGDAVQWTGGGVATNFGEKIIRYNHFDEIGDDGIEANQGVEFYGNIVRHGVQLSGHQDSAQTSGPYIAIHGNLFLGGGVNSFLRIQAGYGSGDVTERFGPFRIYNNAFVGDSISAPVASPQNPIEIVSYNPQNAHTNVIWDDFLFANNTAVGWTNNASTFFGWSLSFGNSGGQTTNGYITNSAFLNNLFVDVNKGAGANWVSDSASPPYGMHYRDQDLNWNFNTVTGTNAASHMESIKRIGFRGTSYTDGAEMSAAEIWTQNTTNMPAFVSYPHSLELAATDTAALNTGTNLGSYFTTDIMGRSRGTVWSRGAFETDAGLLVHLTFEDDFTLARYITDQSGNGNHAHQFGYVGSAAGSNFPNRVSASTTPGTNTSTYAGDFDWHEDGHGIYGRSGDYGAITNIAQLTNMTTATIMVRARYNSAYSGTYTDDANAELLSAGSAVNTRLGSWDFGRWNQQINLNETRFILVTNSNQSTPQNGSEGDRFFGKAGRLVAKFDDGWAPINDGNTTNWNHYAITWSSGILTIYQNGSPIGTNDVSGSTTTLNVGAGWIGVGCNTHVGTNPHLDDGESPAYPNNGFMNGQIDDVMIYNRALTAAEVASASGYTVESGGGGGGGSINTPRLSPKFRNFRAFRP